MLPKYLLASALLALTAQGASPNHTRDVKSKGCGKSLPSGVKAGNSTDQTIQSKSGVSSRKYRIHVPTGYKKDVPMPLILGFHGRAGSTAHHEQLSQFSNSSIGFSRIAVYPEGIPSKDNKRQWQGDPESSGINDILFTNEILDELQEKYCIDTSRVYVNGFSNGGGLTGLLACDSGTTERVAAFAPVAGAFYLNKNAKPPACNPTKARDEIPILGLQGWLDDTIKYKGGINSRKNGDTFSVIDWVHAWVDRNNMSVTANETKYLCGNDKKVTRYSWDNTVVHYNISNIGHVWPSDVVTKDTKTTTCRDADASRVILNWFAKWTL